MEYHHVDYSLPLEVIAVCAPCHKRWHDADQRIRAKLPAALAGLPRDLGSPRPEGTRE
jgi:hypothetical protein